MKRARIHQLMSEYQVNIGGVEKFAEALLEEYKGEIASWMEEKGGFTFAITANELRNKLVIDDESM